MKAHCANIQRKAGSFLGNRWTLSALLLGMIAVGFASPAMAASPTVVAAIPDTTVAEDANPIDNYRDLNNVFDDIEDGSALAFVVQSNDNPGLVTATIDGDSALDFSFTPEQSGSATLIIRATDSGLSFVEDTLVVTVNAVNDQPTVASAMADTTFSEDDPPFDNYRDLNSVFDDVEDGGALTFIIQDNSNPGLLTATIDPDSALDLSVTPGQSGSATLVIRATDSGALSVDDTLVVTVNDRPSVVAAISDTTVSEDSLPIDNFVDLNSVFDDVEEGSALTFAVQSNDNPSLVTVAMDADSTLDLTFAPNQNGVATIVIRATDSGALFAEDTFLITVNAVNDTPVVANALPDTTVNEDQVPLDNFRDLNSVFDDVEDNGALTFVLQSNTNPALVSAVIDADSALDLSFAPEQSGSATLVLRATDSGSLIVEDTLLVTVNSVNDQPTVVASIPDTTVLENAGPVDNYRDLNSIFNDVEEGSALTFNVQSNSNPTLVTATIDADSALDFSFNPNDEGSATIVIRATDSGALFAEETVVVSVHRTLWYIKDDGSGDRSTIQAGINAAVDGDTVLLAAGTYTGNGNHNIRYNGKSILVTSESGPEVTIIDCQGNNQGFDLTNGEGPGAVLSYVTITNATATNGAGLHITGGADPQIIGNIITNCTATDGGGIRVSGTSNPVIRDNRFIGNSADAGGGIYINSSSPTIEGNTFVQNAAASGGAGIHIRNGISNPLISRNVIAFSTLGPGLLCESGGNPTISCSNIFGNAGGDALCGIDGGGNISADPLFCNPIGNTDVSLLNTSPCAAANNGCAQLIGAAGVGCSAPIVVSAISDTTVNEDNLPIDNYVDLNTVFNDGEDGSALNFVIQSNSNPSLLSVVIDADSSLDFSFAQDQNGAATVVIRATDSQSHFAEDTLVVTVLPVNDLPFVAAAMLDTTVNEDNPPIDNYVDLNTIFDDLEDGSVLSFTIQSNSNPALLTASVDADSALDLSFAPDQNGSATVVIRATDTGAAFVEDTLFVTVNAINDVPSVAIAIPDTTVNEDNLPINNYVDLNTVFNDSEDGGSLAFVVQSNSNPTLLTATVDADSALDLSFAPDQNGIATLIIRATDSGTAFVEDTLVITVNGVNDPPVVAVSIPDTTVSEDNLPIGNYVDLNTIFDDVEDGDALSFTIQSNSNPALLAVTLDADSALDLTFAPDQNGSATVVIRATDTGAAFVEDTLVIAVNPVNDPPVVAIAMVDVTLPENSGPVNNYVDLNSTFFDIEDGGALGFVILSNTNPALVNATIGPDSALDLSIAPSQNGVATIVVRAIDSGLLSVNDTLVVTVTQGELTLWATRIFGVPARPGESQQLFSLSIHSTSAVPETLTTITFTNESSGPGTPTQLDANFSTLSLSAQGGTSILPGGAPGPATASFSSGTAAFSNLEAIILPGDTLVLHASGGASLSARDTDLLDLSVVDITDVTFLTSIPIIASWPLNPADAFPVDGMVAQQISLTPVGAASFTSNSIRNLALDVTLPPNGYEPDELNRLDVVNLGTAVNGQDIEKMEAWVDDGDSTFNTSLDTRLGAFSFTGSRWELTGLSEGVLSNGLRVFVSVDIAQSATEGRSIRLSLPALPDVGIGMKSSNDGPLDIAVNNPISQSISSTETVVLSAVQLVPGVVSPGQTNAVLMDLVATNNYTAVKQISQLTFTNSTVSQGAATQSELDSELDVVQLRLDANDNGVLDSLSVDPVIGSSFFSSGIVTFAGLSWNIPAGTSRHVFVTADVSMVNARDGDVLGTTIAGLFDVIFTDATAVIGNWPIDSDAQLAIDGLLAAQITNLGITPVTLGPNDGPVLALNVVIPGNGYANDILNGCELLNLGTATQADISDLRVWRDGGDGVFSQGGGDDTEVGPLVWTGGKWKSPVLSEPLPATGSRLFVGVTVSATPADSASIRLAIPVNGITVASNNDGPIDTSIASTQTILLSSSPLLASLTVDPVASTVGQNVTVRMEVRNVGSELINNVVPSLLATTGSAGININSGPQPASFDLAPGAVDTFTWVYTSTSSGTAHWIGNTSGTGAVSSLPRSALETTSNLHQVFEMAGDLALFPIESMPFLIERGAKDVVPLSFTFSASGGQGASNVRIKALRVRVEDDLGAGIIPSDLLSRVVISEGSSTYLTKTVLETTGAEIDLTLATPVIVPTSEPVTLALRFDILSSTVVPQFRILLQDSTWIVAEDAISGAPVNISLQQSTYPVQSGLGRVVLPPTTLNVQSVAGSEQRVGWNQNDVPLLEIQVDNPGVAGLTTDGAVAALQISVTDTNGVAVASPAQLFRTVRIRNSFGALHAQRDLGVQDSVSAPLTLSPAASVSVGTPTTLIVSADILSTASLGAYRVQLSDSSTFEARDANMGSPLPAVYQTVPIQGANIIVESTADSLVAVGSPAFPQAIAVGSTNVTAINATISHPGPQGTGRIQMTDITLRCQNELRNPLVPGTFIDRVRVFANSVEIANSAAIPVSGDQIVIPISPVLLSPGDAVPLDIVVDISANAPQSFLELLIEAGGFGAVDVNVGSGVVEAGVPLTSGLAQVLPPATELTVGLQNQMPAALAAGAQGLTVATLPLTNTAANGSGAITIDHLVIRSSDAGFVPTNVGNVCSKIQVYLAGSLVGESGILTSDSVTAFVPFPTSLSLLPQQPINLEVRIDLHNTATQNFRVGLDDTDVGVVQPASVLLQVSVEPSPGQTFPLWTEPGSFSDLSLSGSFSNFPNPFAAGNEQTTFVYYLNQDATVTLKIRSARGDGVITIRQDTQRSPGLYQDDLWDGKNGRGSRVVNGVYIAELVVKYADGSSERILRKVAIAR